MVKGGKEGNVKTRKTPIGYRGANSRKIVEERTGLNGGPDSGGGYLEVELIPERRSQD